MTPFFYNGDINNDIDFYVMKKQSKFSNAHYKKPLKKFASQLRSDMTKSEVCLWKYVLSAGKMRGYNFNRQRPVLDYIADFMCKELKLIIELDGITHHDKAVHDKDLKKEQDLIKNGFTVLRFSDGEVLNHINSVKEIIEDYIKQKEIKNYNGSRHDKGIEP